MKFLLILTLMFFLQISTSYAYTEQKDINDGGLSISYPVVFTDNAKSQEIINSDLQKIAFDLKNDFYSHPYYEAELKYKVTYEDDKTISVFMKKSINYDGYRPFISEEGLVYNKITGEKIPLSNYIHINGDSKEIGYALINGIAFMYDSQMNPCQCQTPYPYPSTNYYLKGNGALAMLYRKGGLGCMALGCVTIVIPAKTVNYINRCYKY